jgi:hypothetical protein
MLVSDKVSDQRDFVLSRPDFPQTEAVFKGEGRGRRKRGDP